MFTEPTIVTSNDLKKRSYVTFYFNNERVREYNGKSIGKSLNPNRSKTLIERNDLLKKLRFEIHKALDVGLYPIEIAETMEAIDEIECVPIKRDAMSVFDQALANKINSNLSKKYKRNLKDIHRQFISFLSETELNGSLSDIPVCYGDVDHPIPGQIDHWVS
jgi:hypothetical protein